MRINFVKNLRLATQLYALVAVTLLLTAGLIAHAMLQVRSTQGTLKFTIDNRMVSEQDIFRVKDTLREASDLATKVATAVTKPDEAHDTIASSLDAAKDGWDKYFLAKMIPEEQELADKTTPLLDSAYSKIDKLQEKLGKGETTTLSAWRKDELDPAVELASANLDKLFGLQVKAARMDQDRAEKGYKKSLQETVILLLVGAAVAMTLAFLIIRGALRKLGADPSEAAGIARRIAEGDLQFDMPESKDDQSLLSALRQMKDSLQHSKLDYEGQINAISRVQIVLEMKPDGTILNVNDNFTKAMGYTREEVVGKHHSMLVSAREKDHPEYAQFWARMDRGESRSGTFARQTRDGREIWVHASYNPIQGLDRKTFKIVKYATEVTAERAEAQMNAAFRGALNQLDANIMVIDNELKIIFLNPAATHMFTRAQAGFRTELSSFDATRLIGSDLDVMTRDPAGLRAEVSRLSGTVTRQEVIGGRTMKAIMSPMNDNSGRRLGTALEWFDRTQEVATEKELQDIISAVTAGDLSNRISLEGKRNFFETLTHGINDLVDTIASVVNEVQALVAAANAGDLTKRIQTEGKAGLLTKIGAGINNLTENMATVVSQVKIAAAEVNRGADEISQGNTNLSQRTEEQASSLEETASSMEQMTSTVKQNADNAGQASQLAVAARDQAEKGGAVVAKAVRAMTDINDASKKIADIIGVIDEIAFQTNLLALNAAVEAARAGEQGRGFAVVASEVRNLAGRSATAAKEIKALIQDSVKKVDEGSTLVTQSGATLEQIVSSVKKVTDIVAEIAAASNEQSAGIEQVNKAVMQLDELTQQNAALVEQASAASQSMAEQARGLNESMQGYTVNGATSAIPASRGASAASSPTAERRRPARPWTNKSRDVAAPAKAPRANPTGTDDSVWKEF